jgi:hypothetical protein
LWPILRAMLVAHPEGVRFEAVLAQFHTRAAVASAFAQLVGLGSRGRVDVAGSHENLVVTPGPRFEA